MYRVRAVAEEEAQTRPLTVATGPTNGVDLHEGRYYTPWPDASLVYAKTNDACTFIQQPDLFDYHIHIQAINKVTALPTSDAYTCESDHDVQRLNHIHMHQAKALSTISSDTQTTSSAGSLFSPVQTDVSDVLTAKVASSRGPSPLAQSIIHDNSSKSFFCLGPRCPEVFTSERDLEAHVKSVHTHNCDWAGCDQLGFVSREGLIWHVKAEHLLVCPFPGCTEASFQSSRILHSHITVAHPEYGGNGTKEWQLSPTARDDSLVVKKPNPSKQAGAMTDNLTTMKEENIIKDWQSVTVAKRKCQDQLWNVVEKRAKKNVGTPRSADSPSDMVRSKASKRLETTSFPLVYEHAVLPFLVEFIPKWCGPRHVISVTRGKTLHMRRICIMTPKEVSRVRKIVIAGHVRDILPENFRSLVTFVFCVGEVNRMTWARGLGKDHPDDICAPRNPYFFQTPCMGDSIGIHGNEKFDDSTATLGPCLSIGGASYWLGNFHPFLEAYQCQDEIEIEHPSPFDRKRCIEEAHDAMAQDDDFKIGSLKATSGWSLETTRISHEPYWEEYDKENPLIVTDWALIGARVSHANILRRFPSEDRALLREPIVNTTTAIIPGASVISSGRTSGYQRGQVCEIPAYVSGDENGTEKATREWFVEEPYPYNDEEAWIRGGIGVEGDSGAAIIDADTGGLIGQLWGRNRYWGPGPRQTFFTPIADIFDDIQEKCGQQERPKLPQYRDEAECYPMSPSCRQCYDLRTYLDSRRSSRMSIQSMIMGKGDSDQDLTSSATISELATPRDNHRFPGVEEAGSSFNDILSPTAIPINFPGITAIADFKSPYATSLDLDDLVETSLVGAQGSRKRSAMHVSSNSYTADVKRHRAGY